jgi:pimeloyl-ACP methyl ester carboxylesterase
MESDKQTIVLIHGLWMTSLSWEKWVKRFTDLGYRVIARSWPGMDGEIDELRRDPSPIARLGIGDVVDHYEAIIRGFPALSNPANNHRAVPLTPEQFHYAFTNTLTEEESLTVYHRYAVPGPDHVLFQAAFANFNPHAASAVNFENGTRAPLLLISGGKDHVSPASVVKANFELYRNPLVLTEYKEYPERTHYTLGQDGWEDVADAALDWAMSNASVPVTGRGL